MSLAYAPTWQESINAGRGWIAVALVIFALWNSPGFGMLLSFRSCGGPDFPHSDSRDPCFAIFPVYVALSVYYYGSGHSDHSQAAGGRCTGGTWISL